MDTAILINSFNEKFKRILGLYQQYKHKNVELVLEVEMLKRKLEEKEAELEEVKQKLETKKLAETFLVSEGNTKEARSKINKIVREIDNCIALLNR
jgi:predicted nuclease with TOPRIM domain